MALSLARSARPPRADVVVAAVFLGLSLLQIAIAPIAAPVVSVVVAIGSTVPIAWRRIAPATAALVMTAVWLIPTPGGFLLLGYVIAGLLFYSVGAYGRPLWRVVLVTAAGVAAGVVVTLLGPEIWQAAIGAALAVAGPAAAGRLVAHQRAQNERLRALTEELVTERRIAERVAAAEERARIARELHDVVGHEVTVIALQADAAAAALGKAPERPAARDCATSACTSGRPGCGRRSSSSATRSMPTTRRISPSASAAERRIASTGAAARSGAFASAAAAASACSAITVTS